MAILAHYLKRKQAIEIAKKGKGKIEVIISKKPQTPYTVWDSSPSQMLSRSMEGVETLSPTETLPSTEI